MNPTMRLKILGITLLAGLLGAFTAVMPVLAAAPPATSVCIFLPDACGLPAPVPALSVTLTVTPTTGTAPFSSRLKAVVSGGDTTKPTMFTFYCNRDDGGFAVEPSPPAPPYDSHGQERAGINVREFSCSYANAGLSALTKVPKVIVERGDQSAQGRVPVTVNPAGLVTLTANPTGGVAPLATTLTATVRNVDAAGTAKTVTASGTATASIPKFEVRTGVLIHDSGGRVTFDTPFTLDPKSVVIGRDWTEQDEELAEVGNLTKDGFTLSGNALSHGAGRYREYYIAVAGSAKNIMQAGVFSPSSQTPQIQPSRDMSGSNFSYSVGFPAGSFTSQPDTVVIARDYNSEAGIEIARVSDISATGFVISTSSEMVLHNVYGLDWVRAGAGHIYWIAFKNNAATKGLIQGGDTTQTGSVPVMASFGSGFSTPPTAVAVSRNYWDYDQQMGAISSLTASGFNYSGDGANWTGGKGTNRYVVCAVSVPRGCPKYQTYGPKNDHIFWLAANSGSYPPVDPLKVTFSASRTEGVSSFSSTLTAAVEGADPSQTLNYYFYCDRVQAGTGIGSPSFSKVPTDATSLSTDCTYENAGTAPIVKKAAVIIQRGGSSDVRADIDITVLPVPEFTYTFFCDAADATAATAGGTPVVKRSRTADFPCTYTDAKTYTAKVVVSAADFPTSVATVSIPVTAGPVTPDCLSTDGCPNDPDPDPNPNPNPNPNPPSGDGSDFDYGDGSGTF